jgi:hypothetical protein
VLFEIEKEDDPGAFSDEVEGNPKGETACRPQLIFRDFHVDNTFLFFPIGHSTGCCDVISAIASDQLEKTAPDRSEKGHRPVASCSSWNMKRPVSNFTFYEGYGTLTLKNLDRALKDMAQSECECASNTSRIDPRQWIDLLRYHG